MKYSFILIVLLIVCIPAISNATTEEDLATLADELGKTNQGIDANLQNINDTFNKTQERIEKLSGELAYFKEAKTDVDKKFAHITESIGSIKAFTDQVKSIQLEQVKHREKFIALTSSINRLEKDISVSHTIITWVTAIVSVVVVLVGLFFSKRFLDLYSSYRVICTQFPKEKREDLGLTD